jgi:hypothetical protein
VKSSPNDVKIQGNYEREKRNQNHEKGMDRWNRKTEKTEENRIIPWNMNKDYVWKIKN